MISLLERLGFDTKAGIAATGGDEAFYVELVRDFQSDYLDRVASIRDEMNVPALERIAHDLKGVLRMLGERRVAEMAERWEIALRSNAGCAREQTMVCDALEEIAQHLGTSARL